MQETQSQWTLEQMLEQIRSVDARVAVFDCDGTLWSKDSGSGFMDWTIEKGFLSRSAADWIDTRHRAYRAGAVSEVGICGEMVQVYAGLTEREMLQASLRYMAAFQPAHLFREMALLVEELQQKGVEIWAVSSTNKWVVAEGVRSLGIPADHVLAAEVAVVDGMVTSELIDVPTDEGKVSALRRAGVVHPDLVFGNSVHDLAMLEIARLPVPINPTPALIAAAAERGWPWYLPAGQPDPREVGIE